MTLLPPNATQFQRDLERVNGIRIDTENAVEKIKTIKSDPPEQILYWLIWEYGLGEILPYISDLHRLITDGLKWQRLRGTPRSLKIALGWIGITGAEIEQEPPGLYYHQYQLKLKEVPSRPEIDKIQNLAELSAPVRSRLSRLYNEDYDKRKLILSNGQFGQLLSDYSGYPHQNIVLSFGRKHSTGIKSPEIKIEGCRNREINQRARYQDRPLLSFMSISDAPIPNWPVQHSRLSTMFSTRENKDVMAVTGFDWYGPWSRRTWASPGFIDLGISLTTTHSSRVQVSEIEIGVSIHKISSLQATCPADEISHPHSITNRLVSTQLKQINGEPLSSAGLDWYGPWNRRTWVSPGFSDIGGNLNTTHSSRVQVSEIEIGVSRNRISSIQATGPVGEQDQPLSITQRRVSTQIKQINGEPLSSAGSDWFSSWDKRTWFSPFFINIGVIHHGNTN